jgi:hypothetical protein
MAQTLRWDPESGSLVEAGEGLGLQDLPREQRYRRVRPQDAYQAFLESANWRMQNPYAILPSGVSVNWRGE